MAQRKALGKGLDALIPSEGKASAGVKGNLCPLQEIHPSSRQPRKNIDKALIKELADSIKQDGLLQPLVVRPRGKGRSGYELIAGERRWRASKMVGLAEVPVLVRDVDDREALALSLVENLQREDLNPIEEAEAYKTLISEFGLTQEEISRKVGKDRSSISNSIRLLKLPEGIKKDILEGRLTEGHARAILFIDEPAGMKEVAGIIIDRGLSVREAEDLARNWSQSRKPKGRAKARPGRQADPFIKELENNLKRHLGTKVKIVHKKNKGGRIEIYYYSNEDMERIIGLVRK
jgi:ParB family chromosome partitioning protein